MPQDEHEVAENRWLLDNGMIAGGAGMGRLPNIFRAGSKLVLEIMPSVAATVIGGYLLTQLHIGHSTEPPAQQPAATASAREPTVEPTVGQDRAAMREVLKERREKPETPAEVRAAAAAHARLAPVAPARPAATAAIPVGMDSISPHEPVARPVAPSRPSITAATAAPAAPHERAEAEVYVPAPPPGLPPAPPRGIDAPTVIVPSLASAVPPSPAVLPPTVASPVAPVPIVPAPMAPAPVASAPAPSEPDHQGPVGVVLSTFSNLVGHAANATGHTVNWVIDLPGKAISAGGRAIGVTPPPPPARPLS
jgi:hypothetical protein